MAPSASMARETASLVPGSTRKKTQPPPPAPQTFAAFAPGFRVTSMSRSMRSW